MTSRDSFREVGLTGGAGLARMVPKAISFTQLRNWSLLDLDGPAKPCTRCGHSSDDHRMRDGNDPTDPGTPFPCIMGPLYGVEECRCPDFLQ